VCVCVCMYVCVSVRVSVRVCASALMSEAWWGKQISRFW